MLVTKALLGVVVVGICLLSTTIASPYLDAELSALNYDQIHEMMDDYTVKFPKLFRRVNTSASDDVYSRNNCGPHRCQEFIYELTDFNLDSAQKADVLLYSGMYGDQTAGPSSLVYLTRFLLEEYSNIPWIKHLLKNRRILLLPIASPFPYKWGNTNEGVNDVQRDAELDFPVPSTETSNIPCFETLASRMINELTNLYTFTVALGVYEGTPGLLYPNNTADDGWLKALGDAMIAFSGVASATVSDSPKGNAMYWLNKSTETNWDTCKSTALPDYTPERPTNHALSYKLMLDATKELGDTRSVVSPGNGKYGNVGITIKTVLMALEYAKPYAVVVKEDAPFVHPHSDATATHDLTVYWRIGGTRTVLKAALLKDDYMEKLFEILPELHTLTTDELTGYDETAIADGELKNYDGDALYVPVEGENLVYKDSNLYYSQSFPTTNKQTWTMVPYFTVCNDLTVSASGDCTNSSEAFITKFGATQVTLAEPNSESKTIPVKDWIAQPYKATFYSSETRPLDNVHASLFTCAQTKKAGTIRLSLIEGKPWSLKVAVTVEDVDAYKHFSDDVYLYWGIREYGDLRSCVRGSPGLIVGFKYLESGAFAYQYHKDSGNVRNVHEDGFYMVKVKLADLRQSNSQDIILDNLEDPTRLLRNVLGMSFVMYHEYSMAVGVATTTCAENGDLDCYGKPTFVNLPGVCSLHTDETQAPVHLIFRRIGEHSQKYDVFLAQTDYFKQNNFATASLEVGGKPYDLDVTQFTRTAITLEANDLIGRDFGVVAKTEDAKTTKYHYCVAGYKNPFLYDSLNYVDELLVTTENAIGSTDNESGDDDDDDCKRGPGIYIGLILTALVVIGLIVFGTRRYYKPRAGFTRAGGSGTGAAATTGGATSGAQA